MKDSRSIQNTYPAALVPSLVVSWALSVISSGFRPGRISRFTYELSRRWGITSDRYVGGEL